MKGVDATISGKRDTFNASASLLLTYRPYYHSLTIA